MSSRRTTFEFQVLLAKNWTVQNLFDNENTAKQAAEKELKTNRVEGVRVIRIWKRADGEHTEKVVFEKMGNAKPLHDVNITPVDSAPWCEDEADFLGADSLLLLSRLYRKYSDDIHLTATEILHIYREYKRIWDTESIVMAGVDRVAIVQTRGTETDPKTRSDALYRLIEGIGNRARRADAQRDLPRDVKSTLGAVLNEVGYSAYDDIDRRFLATVVLSRDLASHRDWLVKLDRIGELLTSETEPEALTILDTVTAQIFCNRDVLQDALGPKPNLATALMTLAAIVWGGVAAFDPGMPHHQTFAKMLREGRLPAFRSVLRERFLKMLSGPGDLSRNDPSREDAQFRTLAARFVGVTQNGDSAAIAVALLDRAGLFIVEGGITGRKRALQHLLGAMPTPPLRIRLLRQLDPALKDEPEIRASVFDHLRSLVLALEDVLTLAPDAQDSLVAMAAAAELSRWIAATYPAKPAAPLLTHLDDLCASHLIAKQVIERMDNPDQPLPIRATLLLNFLLSGTLTEGKASALARDRVREHLKRPDFVAAFAAGCASPTEFEGKLRAFHSLLYRAGFSVES